MSLTSEVLFKATPVVVETLVKHYFDKLVSEKKDLKLHEEELLYDETFHIVKKFLEWATHHTVEDVQAFSNTQTPSPPWVHLVRTEVPKSCCDRAAEILIGVFGGEEHMRKIIGGIKWWQTRATDGIDAQWITEKKDYEYHRKASVHVESTTANQGPNESGEARYDESMDGQRCILYLHGGGYYFGSVDQERYCIQRHARKVKGRVFAVNYRLAPQYPFPCALQDAVAAYLYLIDPPEGAPHKRVNPKHIVVSGDSAGGGLSLALLQVIRDSPYLRGSAPAGGVLISPWCDLTHSFPSLSINTQTDVMPPWGLSLQRPSDVWPPPSASTSQKTHDHLKRHSTFRLFGRRHTEQSESTTAVIDEPVHIPEPGSDEVIRSASGAPLIENQVQFYAPNSLLIHPLVSAVYSYLGDLPPLLVIAGDKEVLRDEILYLAHKAANPERYKPHPASQNLYPPIANIQKMKATQVHLQVYDDAAHVLPVLFAFTTPAKYCFRAIASFTAYVTGLNLKPWRAPKRPWSLKRNGRSSENSSSRSGNSTVPFVESPPTSPTLEVSADPALHRRGSRTSGLFRAFSERMKSRNSQNLTTNGSGIESTKSSTLTYPALDDSSDVAGPKFGRYPEEINKPNIAGDVSIYADWDGSMIRERISIEGVIRPLEPEDELSGLNARLGSIPAHIAKRYMHHSNIFTEKYGPPIRTLKPDDETKTSRRQSIRDRFRSRPVKVLLTPKDPPSIQVNETTSFSGSIEEWRSYEHRLIERPPACSIMTRETVEEAMRMARSADLAVMHYPSGNQVWSGFVDFFTFSGPGKAPNATMKDRSGGLDLPLPQVIESQGADTNSDTEAQTKTKTSGGLKVAFPQPSVSTPDLTR